MTAPFARRPRVAISACLLGSPVRYDGQSRLSPATVALSADVEWLSYCPEVELGLGVPREPIELEQHPDGVRLRAQHTGRDLTAAMSALVAQRAAALLAQGVQGCVTKARSPSCGSGTAPIVEPGTGTPLREADGLFIATLRLLAPSLPIIDEERLADPSQRDAFLAAVRACPEIT